MWEKMELVCDQPCPPVLPRAHAHNRLALPSREHHCRMMSHSLTPIYTLTEWYVIHKTGTWASVIRWTVGLISIKLISIKLCRNRNRDALVYVAVSRYIPPSSFLTIQPINKWCSWSFSYSIFLSFSISFGKSFIVFFW
jgi:hypothetical protein